MAHLVEYDSMAVPSKTNVQDLDVTVLAFAQWLSEMRANSKTTVQQMLAEMGIIRNGITNNNTELTEFKRNTATVQQQMQSQISDLRDKLTDAYTEIANMKKTKVQFEQEVHGEYQNMAEQLQFKYHELETIKKGYAITHQGLQKQITDMKAEVHEVRLRGDDAYRQSHMASEQSVNKVGEVEMATQYANTELKRLRTDHDSAIANLADNMNRWNETLRDLSKEFHDFQKVMNVNHQRIQSSLWDVQAKSGLVPTMLPPNGGGQPQQSGVSLTMAEGGRMDSAGEVQRSPPARQAQVASPPPPGSISAVPQGQSQSQPQIRGAAQPQPPQQQTSAMARRVGNPGMVPQGYGALPGAAPGSSQATYVMR